MLAKTVIALALDNPTFILVSEERLINIEKFKNFVSSEKSST